MKRKAGTLQSPTRQLMTEQEAHRLERDQRAEHQMLRLMRQTVITHHAVCSNYSGCGGHAYARCKSNGICPMVVPGDQEDWQFLPGIHKAWIRTCRSNANAVRRIRNSKRGPRLPKFWC